MVKKLLWSVALIAGIGGIGYGIYYYFQQQAALMKQFQYKILGVTFNQVDENAVNGILTFRFTSISSLSITINQFFLNMYVSGVNVGFIDDTTPFILPAGTTAKPSSSDIPFNFNIDPTLVFNNVPDIASIIIGQSDVIITMIGYISFQSGIIQATIPVNCTMSMVSLNCNCTV